MATKRQKLQEEKTNGESDRISALPDALIHPPYPLFMGTRDVVHTSLLSSKWRYFWKSIPNLDFDLDYWLDESKPYIEDLEAFMNFVENVLNSRDNSNIISKFRLYTYSNEFDYDLPRVSKWLIKVLACNVQHIVLKFPLGTLSNHKYDWTGFKLPLDLFARNVKILRISFCPDPLVSLPDICATSLIKKLKVHGVKLPEGNAKKEFILNCNVLEDLTIDYCDANHLETITISPPLLERMHIRLYIKREESRGGRRVKVKTYAKNLKTLVFYGYSCRENSLVDFSIEDDLLFLNSACICIGAERRVVLMEECYQCLVKILPRVCNARELVLDICTKQVLTGVPSLLKGLPCQFHNVKYVTLSDKIASLSLGAILNFLEIFPHIETLVWTRNLHDWFSLYRSSDEEENIENVAEEDPETNLSFQTMFTCLKTLKIVNLEGAKIELDFLRFIFERAVLLKEVIVKCERSLSDDRLVVLKEKLLAMHQVCPNALLTLLEKTPQGFW